MVQRFNLLISSIVLLSFGLALASVDAAFASNCSSTDWLNGSCHVSSGNDGTDVRLDGSLGGAGAGADAGAIDNGNGAWDWNSGRGSAAAPKNSTTPAIFRDGYTVTAALTLADIATFRPNPGTDLMQPNGWMVVGLSTNFFAHATQHVKTGTLLGGPASVRFTPVKYAWTYGDGATRTTSTPGATWSAQGIAEFDATPTSHIYSAPGRYVIDLTIGYAPEYQLAPGTAWIPIRGLVWAPANQLVAVAAAGAKTVLVEDECTVNSGGPGC